MQQFVIEPEVRNNHSYGKGHNDGDQKRFYRNEVNGSRFENLFVMPTKRSLNEKLIPIVASGKKYISMKLHIVSIYE